MHQLSRASRHISKIWLADEAKNTFGGFYSWENTTAMEDFMHSDLVKAVVSPPFVKNVFLRLTFKSIKTLRELLEDYTREYETNCRRTRTCRILSERSRQKRRLVMLRAPWNEWAAWLYSG
jgi:hypothetical protein